jgi:hypothetical protein
LDEIHDEKWQSVFNEITVMIDFRMEREERLRICNLEERVHNHDYQIAGLRSFVSELKGLIVRLASEVDSLRHSSMQSSVPPSPSSTFVCVSPQLPSVIISEFPPLFAEFKDDSFTLLHFCGVGVVTVLIRQSFTNVVTVTRTHLRLFATKGVISLEVSHRLGGNRVNGIMYMWKMTIAMKAMKVVGVSFSHFRMATNSERNDSI